MSLTSCPSCKKQISKLTKTCPNCGRDRHQISPTIFWAAVITFALFFLTPLISEPPSTSKPQALKTKKKPLQLLLPESRLNSLVMRPFEFIGQPMEQMEFLFEEKQDKHGNISSNKNHYQIHIQPDADSQVSYMEIRLLLNDLCKQGVEFNDDQVFRALSIDKADTSFRNGSFGLKIYQHHPSTTKITLGCFINGQPYTMAISRKVI